MKKILLFLLVSIFLLSPITEVYAETSRQRMQRLERESAAARQGVRSTQSLLDAAHSEMAGLIAEMQRYDQKMLDAIDNLVDIELALASTEVRIEDAEADLILAQQDRDLQYEVLRARMRAMHESGPVSMLEVLFQAASFSDLLTRFEAVRVISEADQQALVRLENAENRVIGNIETLSRERNLIGALYFQQQVAIDTLEAIQYANAERLYSLHEDEERIALILEVQEAEQRALDVELGHATAIVRAEEAEAARIAREAQLQREREAQAARTAHLNNFDGRFLWPIPTHSRISSPFGARVNPITRRNETHRGIDIPAPTGTRIVAAADGVVRTASWLGGYGLTVIIDHGNGYQTLYAHNSRNLVTPGQEVTRGEHIANVGSTGQSTGPHVHFEIRRNGTAINPAPLVGAG